MINENRVNALRERHEQAEKNLHDELSHANQNIELIAKLKREKLSLKDEIERLTVH